MPRYARTSDGGRSHEASPAHRGEGGVTSRGQWYEDRREGLGDEFTAAVEATLQRIEEDHLLYPHYEFANPRREIRRALVKRFPYVVVYEVRADELLVLAVAHARQRPGYWKLRDKDEGPASSS